jgi:RNA polymerase sigma-70 factor (ECF subfamily)
MVDGGTATQTAQWVADHHEVLYRYAYRLSGVSADAEDLVQQVFLIAHQNAHQVRDAKCVRGWLFAVLRHCYCKQRRRRGPLPAASVELDVNQLAADAVSDPIDQSGLQKAIDSLADDFKIVVLMFYFEYQSYRQIAEQLQIPLGTVMSRLARAKAQLRRQLFDEESEKGRSALAPSKVARESSRFVPAAREAAARL